MTQAPPILIPPVRSPEGIRPAARAGLAALQAVVVGKEAQVRRAFATMLAGGHVLLEDLPGVGKTTLAKGLSRILGGTFQRVQGTNDLLPSDLLGVHLWDAQEQAFRFQPGPVFCHVLLLDELNRIGPKTQSAMLEAMVEGQVTLDRSTHKLPEPFFVVATQNPHEQLGTYALPESQLDPCLRASWTASPAPSTWATPTARRSAASSRGRPAPSGWTPWPPFSTWTAGGRPVPRCGP